MNTKLCQHKVFTTLRHKYTDVKEMDTSKFKIAAIVLVLSAIILLNPVIGALTASVTIRNSGSILFPSINTSTIHKSEIRAIFVHGLNMLNPDWEQIADYVQGFGINTIIVEVLYPQGSRYPSSYVPSYTKDELTPAINAAHAQGMRIIASFNVLLGAFNDAQKAVGADGALRDWTDPAKQASRDHIKNLVQELSSFQAQSGPHAGETIDGIMWDYIRYGEGMTDTSYSLEFKAKLEGYLGEAILDWPGDFAPSGTRYNEFMEWRTMPINELVRDMRDWALAANPNIDISAAVWSMFTSSPTYFRYWLGQDTTYWVKEGYLDWVSAMIYTTDLATIEDVVQAWNLYGTGGPEGKIPFVAFLTNTFPAPVDPNNFKQQVDIVRANGADGWAIWRYGGPGDGDGSGAPDIGDYLNLIDLYPRFTIRDINATVGEENVVVSWTTDLPATSTVEYSMSPLFNATYKFLSTTNFHYWDVDHIPGAIIEDTTPITSHSIILSGLEAGTVYYFRVQSRDSNGIATSQVYTFKT